MGESVRRLIAQIVASLHKRVRKRPAPTPIMQAPRGEISIPASRYLIAASARPGRAVSGWSVQRDDCSEAVASGLTLAQAKTLCRLLNGIAAFCVAEHGFSARARPPRIQSPDI